MTHSASPSAISSPKTDRPIEHISEDVLERAHSAELFAQNVLSLDFSRGLVVGVLGPWGSGKTSYVNLARMAFGAAEAHLVDFNPWMFSGVDRLVDAFFAEVSAELKLLPQLNEAGKQLEEYGELLSGLGWIPILGPWAERARLALRLVGGGLKKSKGGMAARRKQVERALGKLAKPVIVVLDDIDRLTTQEIRQVFQLVRLTASFPNVIYILAFDRQRVEQALTEDGVPGRAYLEKFLQLAVDLPLASQEVLQSQIFQALDSALAGKNNVGEVDNDTWPNLFFNIVRPLLKSMRDVSRYALSVRGTAMALEDQVALGDVLALESVRIFLPDFFDMLTRHVDLLTNVSDSMGRGSKDDRNKAQLESFLATAGDETAVRRAVLKELFPACRRYLDNYHFGYDSKVRWLRERRVAHESILRLYLERVPSPPLRAHLAAETAYGLLGDAAALDQFLRSVEPALIEDVIAGLETFEESYVPEQVVPGVVTLLNFMPAIPQRPRGMFDFGAGLKVTRVTLRLLRSLKDASAIERAVREILPRLNHLSGKWEVVSDVGHRKGVGHRLVSEEAAAALEAEWRDEVRRAGVEELEGDPDLFRVLLSAQQTRLETEPPVAVPDSPKIALQLLENARSETLSQSEGSYAVRREPRLAWQALVRVFGDEAAFGERIDQLLASDSVVPADLAALVAKYRSGWRPDEE